jgi:APA family basic amino acid/polyamine antiporter
MNYVSKKMGFWAVFALVMGSQIGSGVFMLPAHLAPYGAFGLAGWIVSALGAITLALVFAQLCAWFPQTGGPHVYVYKAFGKHMAFFTGWTYWVISWVSTTVVVAASVGYLTSFLQINSPMLNLALEIALLLGVTALNFKGVSAAGRVEFVLTVLKFVPLAFVPLVALAYFDVAHFTVAPEVAHLSLVQTLSRVALLTFWGFIGIESATTPAGSVENPSKTIPLAVIAGTIAVALLYVLNSVAIMGALDGSVLAQSQAPYADVARVLFGGSWHLLISAIAAIVCIGTLNAWTLTSGQIALGLAQDNLVPAVFGRTNAYGAPYCALLISCLGMIPLLVLTTNASLAAQVLVIIDFSVTAFLFVYGICCISFLKLLLQRPMRMADIVPHLLYGCIALAFCAWIIYQTPFQTIAIATLFSISGVPLYWRLVRS